MSYKKNKKNFTMNLKINKRLFVVMDKIFNIYIKIIILLFIKNKSFFF